MFKKLAFLSPTLLLMAVSIDAKAEAINAGSFAWGRAQFSAAQANQNLGIAGSDVMLPFYRSSRGFFYGDAMGDVGSDGTYIASPGIGYRGLYNNQIFGAYFFDDYEETSYGGNFWVLSPGVEWITPEWDVHLNAYFPTTTQQQTGPNDFASNLGDYSHVTFVEGTHEQWDEIVTPYAIIGNGVDAAVGYSFDPNGDYLRAKVSLGAYYYQAPSNDDVDNITGLTACFSNALTQDLSVSMTNSYDQLNHYNVSVNLTYTFGGNSNTFSENINDRLLDPVERHVGIIATGAGQYDQQQLEGHGLGLQYDNVYFASANGTGNGTYGDAMSLTQSNLTMANDENSDGARIYLQGGSSEIYYIGSQSALTTDGLSPYDGQDFYGRTSDYTAPAAADDQPQVITESGYNGFILTDGSNIFSDFTISSVDAGSADTSGIVAQHSTDDEEVLTLNDMNITGFAAGVYVDNISGRFTMNATNSTFNDNGDGTSVNPVYGMEIINESNESVAVNATNSQFNNNSGATEAAGLYLLNLDSGAMTLNATSSEFNNNSVTQSDGNVYGVYASNNGANALTITIVQSTFDSNNSTADDAYVYGFYTRNTASGNVITDIANSTFNNNTSSGSSSSAYGMAAVNNGAGDIIITANNATFNNNTAAGASGLAYGLYAGNFSTGQLQIMIDSSEFNNNLGELYGYGMNLYNGEGNVTMRAIDSEFNNNSVGLLVDNESTTPNSLDVTSLSGSSFNDNNRYGIYNYTGSVNEPDSPTDINLDGVQPFEGNAYGDINW